MYEEDKSIRTQKDSCVLYNNCKATQRAMYFSDSIRADFLLHYVKKNGWPSIENGSLFACMLAIHDHKNHRYYDSVLYKAIMDGKAPLDVLLLIETWKRNFMDFDKLMKLLREKESVKILLTDLGEFKGLSDSTMSTIKRELKRLCPIEYYFTCESDTMDKRDFWCDKNATLQSEDILLITTRYIIANTCYANGKQANNFKKREYYGLYEVHLTNKVDNEEYSSTLSAINLKTLLL